MIIKVLFLFTCANEYVQKLSEENKIDITKKKLPTKAGIEFLLKGNVDH